MKFHLSLAAAVLAMAPCAPAHAVIVFSDSFDAEGATTLNYNGFAKWTVSDGTVDLIGTPNGYGITCAGGVGSCVDMDGSSGDAGVMTAIGSWAMSASDEWTLKFKVSGSQRSTQGSAFDTVEFGLLFDDGFASTVGIALPWDFPMTSFTFTFLGHDGIAQLYMKGIPESRTDSVGLIVDDVSLEIDSAVPEPASWLMMIGGLGVVGGAMRRRRMAVSFG